MKETIGSIIVKLLTLATFVVLIIGGMCGMYYSYTDENWWLFAVACCMLTLGFYAMGILCQLIMRYENHGSLEGLSPLDCLVSATITMYFASTIIFSGFGIMVWMDRGLWQAGIAGIADLVVMIIVAIEVGIRYKMDNNAPKKVKKNPNAVRHSGKIISINGRMPIMIIVWFPLIHEYLIEIDGVKSTAFIRHTSKLWKGLTVGSKVNVLFDPEQPKYCVILSAEPNTSNSDNNY